MKRKITFLMAAFLLLATFAIPKGMWGQTASFTPENFSGQGTSGTGSEISATVDGVTFACDKGYGTTQIRCYSGGTITISSDNTITGISFTFSGSNYTGGLQTSYSNWATSWTQTLSSQARITACDVTYTTGGDTPTTYTVTFDAGDGTFVSNSDFPNTSNTVAAGTYTLPSATPAEGYIFNGCALGENTYEGGASYIVTSDADFTASYTENTTPADGITATLNIAEYAAANNWTNSTQYTTATVAPVTFTANGGSNTGKYYTNGQDWRFYQNENASLTISVPNGYTLVSITPTYSVNNGGVLKNGNSNITSGTTVAVSGTMVTFTIGNSGTATNGQVRFTNIDVVYVADGGTQTASDLAITNATTELTFDLYNNATAQVINYITSSTGTITITPAESNYFTYVHDATAKTITVTPTAVTPSAQTVTISQEADEDYYAGTASFTVSVANSDPNIPGTATTPYTVAQARAAIDANSGITGVYATGIVSAIPTAWNTQYSNITFNFVDEEGDEDFLQAYRCVSGTGVDASQVAVGDIVVVYGNLTKYNSTYEFAQNCQLVSLEHPQSTEPSITVTPNTINAPVDGAEGTLTINYENIPDLISFDYYFCDANGTELEDTDPDWINAAIEEDNDGNYSVEYTIDANTGDARMAYFKVYTFVGDDEVYCIVTVNQAEYVAPTYAELPFEFIDKGRDDIEGTNGLYQEGLGADYSNGPKLKFDNTGDWLLLQFNERPGTLSFNIKNNSFSGGTFTVQTSEDGVTYTDLETYTAITDTQSEEFTNLGENVRYIKWIYTQKVSGNVGLGNIVLEAYDAPVLEPSLTITPDILNVDYDWHMAEQLSISYNDLVIENYQSFTVQFCDTEGQEIEQPAEEDMWLIIGIIQPDLDQNDYLVNCFVSFNEGEARTRCFKLFAYDANNNKVYSNLVTVNQGAFVAPLSGDKYVKVTSTADLTDGQYLIVYEEGSVAFDGGLETLDAVGNTIAVEVTDNNEIAVTDETTAAEFTIDMTAGSIKSASGYYIGQTADANGLATSEDEPIINTISIEDDENASIVSANTHLRYNSASNQTRFRYFKSSSYTNQKAIQLYKKVEAATETHTLEIVGYDDNDGGYYLIASPVTVDPTTAVDPDTQEHMILTGEDAVNYDLYYFDEAQTEEWRNYKQAAFSLEPGKGYLYAHKRGGNFTLTGTPYEGDGTIRLNKKGNGTFAGWNLVGNPFNTFATIDRNEFYVMRSDGGEIITSETNRIEAMQGIFVIAENDQETVTFTGYAPLDEGAKIVINVMKNRNTVVDRAIVNLNNHGRLPKFMLNPDNTKVYIPQDNIEYAVAKSEDVQGEMPINFHAAENGTYTFSVNAKNTEMDYLHLIDNKTGEEIDLKANPNYSFDANVSDIEARFTLIFNANTGVNENVINTFAYFNGSEWIINNTDNATVEVVDMLGRVVMSQNAAQHISTSTMASGVYTLRLTNGNEVKTQKIVVK